VNKEERRHLVIPSLREGRNGRSKERRKKNKQTNKQKGTYNI